MRSHACVRHSVRRFEPSAQATLGRHMLDSSIRSILMAVVLSLAPALAAASDTRWVCWYNNDATVPCVLLQAAADSDEAERAVKISQPAPGARVLPPSVRRIIRADKSLLDAQVVLPLFSEPESEAFVEQLANFTTCFGKPDCHVTFWRPRTVLAQLD